MPRRIPPYGPVIRYLRTTAGLSEAALASKIGQPVYYVNYLENGFRWPRPPLLRALAEAFDWDPFELALLADVEIPYPDWPRLDDLGAWRKLATDWTRITDAIARYALARELFLQPAWQARLDPDLPMTVEQFGIVACYEWLRRRWTPYAPHPSRLRAPSTAEDLVEAAAAGAAGTPVVKEPDFLQGLSAHDRATVQAVAESLKELKR